MATKKDLFEEEKENVEYTVDWFNMIFGNIFNVPLLALVIYGLVQLIIIAQGFDTPQLKVLALL